MTVKASFSIYSFNFLYGSFKHWFKNIDFEIERNSEDKIISFKKTSFINKDKAYNDALMVHSLKKSFTEEWELYEKQEKNYLDQFLSYWLFEGRVEYKIKKIKSQKAFKPAFKLFNEYFRKQKAHPQTNEGFKGIPINFFHKRYLKETVFFEVSLNENTRIVSIKDFRSDSIYDYTLPNMAPIEMRDFLEFFSFLMSENSSETIEEAIFEQATR